MAMLSKPFEPFFGEARIDTGTNPKSEMLHPVLFHFYASDGGSCVNLHVTDFRSNYWISVLSVHQLEDMRDSIGVGDNLAEFIDYMIASIKSDSKLIIETHSEPIGGTGPKNAKLVAQRSKGMPFVSIYLNALDNYPVSEAVRNFSWIIFKEYERMKKIIEEYHMDGVILPASDPPFDFKSNVNSMKDEKGTSSENQTGSSGIKLQKTGLGHQEIGLPATVNKLETKGAYDKDTTDFMQYSRRRGRGPRGAMLQCVEEE